MTDLTNYDSARQTITSKGPVTISARRALSSAVVMVVHEGSQGRIIPASQWAYFEDGQDLPDALMEIQKKLTPYFNKRDAQLINDQLDIMLETFLRERDGSPT